MDFVRNRDNCVTDEIMTNESNIVAMKRAFVKEGFPIRFIGANQLISHDKPHIMPQTASVHVLSNRPLTSSHGKKVIAKEFGLWEGSNGYLLLFC